MVPVLCPRRITTALFGHSERISRHGSVSECVCPPECVLNHVPTESARRRPFLG